LINSHQNLEKKKVEQPHQPQAKVQQAKVSSHPKIESSSMPHIESPLQYEIRKRMETPKKQIISLKKKNDVKIPEPEEKPKFEHSSIPIVEDK